MPDITFQNQPFDLAFHPSSSTVYASLLTGEVKAFSYSDETGESSTGWTARPTKKCCRGVVVEEESGRIWAVGKSGGIFCLDGETGATIEERPEAHGAAINRITNLMGSQFATGDDEGMIKIWDRRQKEVVREYPHHWEYISDFVFHEDKRQLLSTSGDGTISVIDVRFNKAEPMAQSEDQEDELLSIVPIKGNMKHVVGSQLGILSVWDRSKGWGDSVDRIPGHPASVETMVALTPDIVATGSEDGLIRVIQVQPNKFLGVIASHGEFPIERMKLDRNAKWLGSVSHDDTLKMTDVSDLFEDSDEEGEGAGDDDDDEDGASEGTAVPAGSGDDAESDSDDSMTGAEQDDEGDDTNMETSDDEEDAEARRREKKRQKRQERKERKQGLNGKGLLAPREVPEEAKESENFFDDL